MIDCVVSMSTNLKYPDTSKLQFKLIPPNFDDDVGCNQMFLMLDCPKGIADPMIGNWDFNNNICYGDPFNSGLLALSGLEGAIEGLDVDVGRRVMECHAGGPHALDYLVLSGSGDSDEGPECVRRACGPCTLDSLALSDSGKIDERSGYDNYGYHGYWGRGHDGSPVLSVLGNQHETSGLCVERHVYRLYHMFNIACSSCGLCMDAAINFVHKYLDVRPNCVYFDYARIIATQSMMCNARVCSIGRAMDQILLNEHFIFSRSSDSDNITYAILNVIAWFASYVQPLGALASEGGGVPHSTIVMIVNAIAVILMHVRFIATISVKSCTN